MDVFDKSKHTDTSSFEADSSASSGPYRVKIWEKRLRSGNKLLRLQLLGNNGQEGVPLVIEERNQSIPNPDKISTRTDAPAILQWAKDEVKFCEEHHESCRNYFISHDEEPFRPTRLLKIEADLSIPVRLVETEELAATETLEYVALSHCWGKDGIHNTLKTSNIADLKKSINDDFLTKNFRHAIAITRAMQFQWLWIDSLCICQDSDEDRHEETTTMGLVYASATCTISATSSANSEGGCFHSTVPFLGDCILRYEGNMSLRATFPGEQENALAELFHQHVDNPKSAPVTTRGWTFQERVLSNRILHFCNGVVLFECNMLQSSSCHRCGTSYPRISHVRSDGVHHVNIGPNPSPLPSPPSWPAPTLVIGGRGTPMYIRTVEERKILSLGAQNSPRRKAKIPMYRRNSEYKRRHYTSANFYNLREGWNLNKAHAAWRPTRPAIVDMSARLGMRGAFEMLVNFKGMTPLELLEFHISWYEIVRRYSVRNLTKSEDKLRAMGGIAYLVQKCTAFTYRSGLWENTTEREREINEKKEREMEKQTKEKRNQKEEKKENVLLHLNLLWARKGSFREKPQRSAPTWTWAAIDGEVEQKLMRKPQEKGEQAWDKFDILAKDMNVTDEGLLSIPECHFWQFDRTGVDFIPDRETSWPEKKLICVPILKLQARKQHELHGLVLRSVSRNGQESVFERIGYFTTTDAANIEALLENLEDSRSLNIR